jgi:protein-S-isoprenylcysteine O-methyltransferase Ste14
VEYADWQRAAVIYFPLGAAIVARLLIGPRPRQFAGCLLSILWTVPSLLALQRWNEYEDWWRFGSGSAAEFRGMPLELFLGWIILWGLLPHLAFPRVEIIWSAAVLVAIDCMLMPLASAAVFLEPHWLVGEAAGVAMVLLPALCIGRWTIENTNLRGRAALQIATSGLLFLFLIPEIIFAVRPGQGWAPLVGLPGWLKQFGLQSLLLLALPGLSAVMEFVERGQGTPIPYDPPQRLVTSGVYRYCANPMQLSCALIMFAWAGILRNGWMLLATCMSVVYSAGIAEWDEREDLSRRFGAHWREYRSSVGTWWPRWIPYHTGPPALIYLAGSCGLCTEVRAWLEQRVPTGLQIIDAETLSANSIRRVRYNAGDGGEAVEGVRAIGRALEHLHLGWALLGMALRLPILWRMIQLFMDASGLGPRTILSNTEHPILQQGPGRISRR